MVKIKIFFIYIIVLSLGLSLVYGAPKLECKEELPCTGGRVKILGISDTTNAHAETPTESNYGHSICCKMPSVTLDNPPKPCSSNPSLIPFLKLSGTTNAHVEKSTETNYGTDICITSPDTIFSCGYVDDPSQDGQQVCDDNGFETCLATISGDTNAHVADCTVSNSYSKKICCKSDCTRNIEGKVKSANPPKKSIEGAEVQIISLGLTDTTDAQGDYSLPIVECSTSYEVTANHNDFFSVTKTITTSSSGGGGVDNLDFDLPLGSSCRDDCTHFEDNRIHEDCIKKNKCDVCVGCVGFCDKNIVAESCDFPPAQPGWIRPYVDPVNCGGFANGCVIDCAKGCPTEKVINQVTVLCENEDLNLIKITKLVSHKGKLVRLVVAVCG